MDYELNFSGLHVCLLHCAICGYLMVDVLYIPHLAGQGAAARIPRDRPGSGALIDSLRAEAHDYKIHNARRKIEEPELKA